MLSFSITVNKFLVALVEFFIINFLNSDMKHKILKACPTNNHCPQTAADI